MFDDFSIMGFPSGIVGDYNTDSFVDIIDILGIVDLFILDCEPSQRQLFFCDLDRNGSINIMDLMALVDMVSGNPRLKYAFLIVLIQTYLVAGISINQEVFEMGRKETNIVPGFILRIRRIQSYRFEPKSST